MNVFLRSTCFNPFYHDDVFFSLDRDDLTYAFLFACAHWVILFKLWLAYKRVLRGPEPESE